MKFKVVLYETDEGVAVKCPTLPGCLSEGETRDEALENIQIGIREFLEATWAEVNENIAKDAAEFSDLLVSYCDVEVDVEGVEDSTFEQFEAAI